MAGLARKVIEIAVYKATITANNISVANLERTPELVHVGSRAAEKICRILSSDRGMDLSI